MKFGSCPRRARSGRRVRTPNGTPEASWEPGSLASLRGFWGDALALHVGVVGRELTRDEHRQSSSLPLVSSSRAQEPKTHVQSPSSVPSRASTSVTSGSARGLLARRAQVIEGDAGGLRQSVDLCGGFSRSAGSSRIHGTSLQRRARRRGLLVGSRQRDVVLLVVQRAQVHVAERQREAREQLARDRQPGLDAWAWAVSSRTAPRAAPGVTLEPAAVRPMACARRCSRRTAGGRGGGRRRGRPSRRGA